MLNQLKLILDELFRIWREGYQSMQLYLRAGFSPPAKATFFMICTGDSSGAGYCLSIMPRPVHEEKLFIKKFLTSFCFCIMEFRKQKNMFCTSATLLCFTQNNIRIIKSNWFHLKFSKYFWNIFNLENIFRMLNNSVYFQNIVVCNEN